MKRISQEMQQIHHEMIMAMTPNTTATIANARAAMCIAPKSSGKRSQPSLYGWHEFSYFSYVVRPNPLLMSMMPDMPGIFAKASSDTVTNLQLLSVLSDMHNPIVATMATARESHPCGSELVYM